MKDFSAKVAAITGAGSGIGRSLAQALAQRGCHLALADIQAAGLADTAAACRAHGIRVTTALVDVARREEVQQWAAATVQAHGQVNLLVNNAGVALSALAEHAPMADMEWLMGINFWGVVHGTQAFLPHLRASGEGHLVNLSSLFGLMAMPTQSIYNASKFAVRGYTEALRIELELEGAPVGVTCVHPGGVATNIAWAARVHGSVLQATGETPEEHRRQSNLLLQTTSADSAARQIIAGIERNARRVVIGRDARALDVVVRLLGPAYQRLVVREARRMLSRAAARSTTG